MCLLFLVKKAEEMLVALACFMFEAFFGLSREKCLNKE